MEINKAQAAIEAILFASGEPIPVTRIAEAVGIEDDIAAKLLHNMADKYKEETSGLFLAELDGSFQLCTKPEFAPAVKDALEIKRDMPLSNAAMEILAIIAYNQPVTKSFIEQVRGVDSSQTVNSLAEKGLVEEAGRLELPGRPIAYRTTAVFLRCFGIKSLDELPPLPDESGQVMLGDLIQPDMSDEPLE